MSLDLLAIADALAARYAPANVTPPTNAATSTAYPNIRAATARVPNNIPATPYVIVELPSGELTIESRTSRHGEHVFDVWFLYSKATGDLPRDKAAMLAWISVLLDQTYGQHKLGLAPIVDKANVDSYEPDVATYGGDSYHAWHLVVRVWTTDTINLVP